MCSCKQWSFFVYYIGRLKWPHLQAVAKLGSQLPGAEATAASTPLDMPTSFVSWRPCIWCAGHGHSEANKLSTDNKCRSDRWHLSRYAYWQAVHLDSQKLKNSIPGIKKKDQDWRLASLVDILKALNTWHISVYYVYFCMWTISVSLLVQWLLCICSARHSSAVGSSDIPWSGCCSSQCFFWFSVWTSWPRHTWLYCHWQQVWQHWKLWTPGFRTASTW